MDINFDCVTYNFLVIKKKKKKKKKKQTNKQTNTHLMTQMSKSRQHSSHAT